MRISIIIALTVASLVASGSGDLTITVSPKSVAVSITGDFAQGLPSSLPNTTARAIGNIPVFTGQLSGQNSTSLRDLLSKAISAKSPGASAANVSFSASSNQTWMHYSMGFDVNGIFATNPYVEKMNLAWRSFALEDDFEISGVSINRLFQTYLQQTLLTLASSKPSGPIQITSRFYLNDQFIQNSILRERTNSAVLLNFTSLSLPLAAWRRTQLPGLAMRLDASTGFNMTLLETVTEAGESASVSFNAVNKLTATIQAPFARIISGDEIYFETNNSNLFYTLMMSIPVLGLALFLSTNAYERRILRERVSLKGRRRKAQEKALG